MCGQLLGDAGMFTGRGVFAEPAGKSGEVTHIASHELSGQHTGIDSLSAHKHTSTMKTLWCQQHMNIYPYSIHDQRIINQTITAVSVCVTWVGRRDQFCLERICLSTRSPSLMESAVLLINTRWDFRLLL